MLVNPPLTHSKSGVQDVNLDIAAGSTIIGLAGILPLSAYKLSAPWFRPGAVKHRAS